MDTSQAVGLLLQQFCAQKDTLTRDKSPYLYTGRKSRLPELMRL